MIEPIIVIVLATGIIVLTVSLRGMWLEFVWLRQHVCSRLARLEEQKPSTQLKKKLDQLEKNLVELDEQLQIRRKP